MSNAADQAMWAAMVAETERLKNDAERYRLTLVAIKNSTLTGVDYGDWVQAACEDALEGMMPECPHCGTYVHEGECVTEEGERA